MPTCVSVIHSVIQGGHALSPQRSCDFAPCRIPALVLRRSQGPSSRGGRGEGWVLVLCTLAVYIKAKMYMIMCQSTQLMQLQMHILLKPTSQRARDRYLGILVGSSSTVCSEVLANSLIRSCLSLSMFQPPICLLNDNRLKEVLGW